MIEQLTLPMKLAIHGLSVLETHGDQLVMLNTILGDAASMTISLSDIQQLGYFGLLQAKSGLSLSGWNTDTEIMLTLKGWKAAKLYHKEVEAVWFRHKEQRWRNYYNNR